MTTKPIKNYTQQAWSLDDLFPAIESEAVKTAVADLETLITAFEAFQPKLNAGISQTDFQPILDTFEKIVRQIGRLNGYAWLSFAANTQDQQAQNFMAYTNQLKAESRNRILFFELWWKAAPEAVVTRLLPTSGDYHYWLETLRLEVPHTLT